MSHYPFVPKSTVRLRPGDYWSIPLSNGRFACGRVIQLAPTDRVGSRRLFLAGLLDWSSEALPSYLNIGGCKVLQQGAVHIKAITENAGVILGNRPLQLDGIEPGCFLDSSPGPSCLLMKGFDIIRGATTEEQRRLPVFSTWGYEVMLRMAEDFFRKSSKPA